MYRDPDLPPSHHYLAAYWLPASAFGAHALCTSASTATSSGCPAGRGGFGVLRARPAIGSEPAARLPLPGQLPREGTQAKRRAHATLVDHLVPPMARAESYGDIARLEQLLDEYGNVWSWTRSRHRPSERRSGT